MKRGEIYAAAARGAYTGKPRPVVVLQDDRFDSTSSITVCPFTTQPVSAPLIRLDVEPSATNGLERVSYMMVDKLTTMPRANIGERLGQLEASDVVRLNRAVLVFLGLAG